MKPLALTLTAGSSQVLAQSGTRLLYVLLETGVQSLQNERPTVNCVVLADASPSMRIPFVDDATFKEIMRRGYANEVIIDGLPVWKLESGIPEEFHDRMYSPIRWLRRAIGSLSERLGSQDRLSVIAFGSTMHTLLEHGTPHNARRLRSQLKQLDRLNLGDQTVLAPALEQAFELVMSQQRQGFSEKLILITDGFVIDAQRCLELSNHFAEARIPITTLGLGFDFEETLLLGLADRTGGTSQMLADPAGIPAFLDQEIQQSLRSQAHTAYIRVKLSQGVEIRRAYRVKPMMSEIERPPLRDRTLDLLLGSLEPDQPQAVLLEMLIPPRDPGIFRLCTAITYAQDAQGRSIASQQVELIVNYSFGVGDSISPALTSVVEKVIAWRLQQEALDALAQGDTTRATRKLEHATQRLQQLGEIELAHRVAETAKELERTGTVDAQQTKELRYATRRLTP